MNGRVYDPVVGRFLSADPVAVIGHGQGANTYAYVWNNPLSLTDPSGFIVQPPDQGGSLPCTDGPQWLCDLNSNGGVWSLAGVVRWEEGDDMASLPGVDVTGKRRDEGLFSGGGSLTRGFDPIDYARLLEDLQRLQGAGLFSIASPFAMMPMAYWDEIVVSGSNESGRNSRFELRRHLFNGTFGASAGVSGILGPMGGDVRIGVYFTCCESPDFGLAFSLGTPVTDAPNLSITDLRHVSVGALVQAELYGVALHELQGTGSAISLITPWASATEVYGEQDLAGDPVGHGAGFGRGWGASATNSTTHVISTRQLMMDRFGDAVY